MKDEIKEILDKAKEISKYGDDGKQHTRFFNQFEAKSLLDYITNLQERKVTKEDVDKYFEENMCVSFDKFIENWNEQEKLVNYYEKEIERLNKEKDDLDDYNRHLHNENKRLNNIINELEKWLNEQSLYGFPTEISIINSIERKLKELKEGK